MLPPRRFVFLRHGQTEWNRESRIQGHTDMPLNAVGLAQAEAAAARVSGQGITRIVSSPLIRALKTAAVVAERLALPIDIDSELMERKFGSFEGRVAAEVKREHGLPLDQPITVILPPDAEHWPQTRERTRAVFAKWLARHSGDTLMFVSHDGLFRALHEQLLGTRPEATHAAPYLFEPKGASWSVTELGGGA